MTLNRIPARLMTWVLLPATLGSLPALANDFALPAQPPAQRTVSPTEQWRIGGEDDEDILLGMIGGAVQGPDGNTYLLDSQLSQVLVISPDGELVTTLGREGDGPGELRRPHGLFFKDEDTLGIVQGFPAKITLLELDGTPAGTIAVGGEADEGGFNFLNKAMTAAGKLVVQKGRGTFDPETSKSFRVATLSVLDMEGTELATICTKESENDFSHRVYDEAKDFSEMNVWTLSPAGIIYTAPERDAYAVNAYDLDGKLLHTLRRPFSPRKRTAEDKKKMENGVNMIMNGRRLDVETHFLDTDPDIRSLQGTADGRLFVASSHDLLENLPAGIGARYDVISPEGEFLEELSLRIPNFDAANDRLMFLDGEHFLHLRNIQSAIEAARAAFGGNNDKSTKDDEDQGEAEPMEVVLYRLS